MTRQILSLAGVALLLGACSGSSAKTAVPMSSIDHAADGSAAADAAALLGAGELERARDASAALLSANSRNATAAAVRGFSVWLLAGQGLLDELEAAFEASNEKDGINHPMIRAALEQTLTSLMSVRADFEVAATNPQLSLAVCLACWKRDWNRSGTIDERDHRIMAIDFDRNGADLPAADPRRTPTFGFDVGDAHWAIAMSSFQAAALEIVLAFDSRGADALFFGMPSSIELKLLDGGRVQRGRDLILVGLDSSDAARLAYLAETDDNVEWVPNPSQKNYPMPLEVDADLYAAWEGIISDVRGLVAGETGINLIELAALVPELTEVATVPTGYLDVGAMLNEPRSIRVSMAKINASVSTGSRSKSINSDTVLSEVFGVYYKTEMKASPLTKRLVGLADALKSGEAALERKLFYLFWLN